MATAEIADRKTQQRRGRTVEAIGISILLCLPVINLIVGLSVLVKTVGPTLSQSKRLFIDVPILALLALILCASVLFSYNSAYYTQSGYIASFFVNLVCLSYIYRRFGEYISRD